MGAPTSKASCLSEIDSLTRQYQQCMKNIECYNMNMINSSPSQKSFYKTLIHQRHTQGAGETGKGPSGGCPRV